MDTATTCIKAALQIMKIQASEASLLALTSRKQITAASISSAFRGSGMLAYSRYYSYFDHDNQSIYLCNYDDSKDYFLILKRKPGVRQSLVIFDPKKGLYEEDYRNILGGIKSQVIELRLSEPSRESSMRAGGSNWLKDALTQHREDIYFVLLASILLNLISLISPILMQVIMDKVISSKSSASFIVIIILLACAAAGEVLLTMLRQYQLEGLGKKIDVALSMILFSHILSLPLGYHQTTAVGVNVGRINDVSSIRQFITGNALIFLVDSIFSIIYIAFLFYYSATLASIVTLSLFGYAIVSAIYIPIFSRKIAARMARISESFAFLVEALGGIRTIKSSVAEWRWNANWMTHIDAQTDSHKSAREKSIQLGSIFSIIGKFVTILILWFGVNAIFADRMTIGELVAFNFIASFVAQPIQKAAFIWNEYQEFISLVRRNSHILATPAELVPARQHIGEISGALAFHNVWHRYAGRDDFSLRNISFSVSAGSFNGIIGRSGSGKSTIGALLQRNFDPDQGIVEFDGKDIRAFDIRSLREQIGVVHQETNIFSRSVADNIAIGRGDTSREQIIEAAKLAGIHDFIASLPLGYDTLLEPNGSQLSGGQKQRIAIARALVSKPKILIFDEATSALDNESESVIMNNILRISRGRTVIFITHKLSLLQNADKILILDKGQLSIAQNAAS